MRATAATPGFPEPHLVSCALCGLRLPAERAAGVRFTAREQVFFCTVEHSERFSFAERPTTLRPGVIPATREALESTSASDAGPETWPSAASHESEPTSDAFFTKDELARSGAPSPSDSAGGPEAPAPRYLGNSSPSLSALPVEGPVLKRIGVRGSAILRLAPPALGAVAFLVSARADEPLAPPLLLVAVLLLSAVVQERLAERLERQTVRTRRRIRASLDVSARRLHGEEEESVAASAVRPGEEITVESGELIAVDGAVVAGEAEVWPWPDAVATQQVRMGSRVLAGAKVEGGTLRVVCTASGRERTLAPLVERGKGRLDRALPAARFAERLGLHGAPVIGALLGATAWLLGASIGESLGVVAASWGALCGALFLHLPAELGARRLLGLGRAGIFFPSASLLDSAGQVSIAVLCARGTILHGEPEVAEVEALREATVERVLSLAAGAESLVPHPIASAILRAADARQLVPDASRHHHTVTGMGVLCVSSRGVPVVVGSRELLLRERISIAVAEETLRKYESQGKTALLVAEDQHLLGVLALVDGLRPGARAMIQRLSEARFEPVLLSGDSRQTSEAVGRALGVEHLRPEIPATERGLEVSRLMDGGAIVAVVGRTGFDDTALHAAKVPVVLGLPSGSIRDRAVSISNEQPLEAARALVEAQELRHESWVGLLFSLVPAALGSVAVASLLLPASFAPLLSAVASGSTAFLLLRRKRSNDPGRQL